MTTLWVLYGTIITTVVGHIQLSSPLPIRSPLNADTAGAKDYSYTSPLSATGWDFPCKGYHRDPFVSVINYTAGQAYPLALAGTATHGGGSCQISLSYDLGETFHVIKSIVGGCPEPLRYSFRIPDDAPRGPALLAWTWFNKIGNREMYMNCAQVTIQAPSDQHQSGTTGIGRTQQLPWEERPPIFLANINAEGQCSTIEGEEVNFPMPGDDVEGAVQGAGYQCSGPAECLSGTGQGATRESSVPLFPKTSVSRGVATPTSCAAHKGYSITA